jgi:heme O synthase-like polyprenyltransferase
MMDNTDPIIGYISVSKKELRKVFFWMVVANWTAKSLWIFAEEYSKAYQETSRKKKPISDRMSSPSSFTDKENN